ncbi:MULTISPECIES: nucleobase:cation symporter-2 family protein [unclassified Cupriavidus]|uniref:nucleobase:cation symporter-2 family protein n=1 Tax=unclassified Cupriavidus TaxID=2640874 RepID=UPI001C001605|nr:MULTISPECIES: nucleobase:cation symporter-2 family protein [unclassified Cupriavidus]MCA3192361.1 purine permease [Cupriavidus sp.]MCA3196136.1 purine permease [Cupriavidus sp.]MCA3203669.1 purine permease [Cupriavidus sp.]MCA3206245.1 purine permease [Cupriavidus sp.]MCA3231254.1 purine permease [Cupriavidus sp.]
MIPQSTSHGIDAVHPVDEVLPPIRLAALGLQHVLVMYAGAIAVPLIIGGALHLPKDQIAFLIAADLFCCGLVTMIQSIGIWKIGIRLPVMMGVTFTAIAPIIATGSNPSLGLPAVFGAVMVAGVFTFVAAPYVSRLIRWFPPVVTGTVVLVIGISLMRVGVNWAAGGNPMLSTPTGPVPNPAYGLPVNLGIATVVLLTVLGMIAFFKGFLCNIAVLIGITTGFVIAVALGKVSFAGVHAADWVALITPFHFGWPTFDLMTSITLCVVMVVIMIEGVGQFLALGEIVDRPVTPDDLARGLRADGVGALVGAVFNTFTYTSYAQNVGLVQVTGVRSRWVCATAGGILIVLGCLPKLAFFAASIPQYVLGGAALVMFGMVAATGVRILGHVDFVENKKNAYIVAVSLALGMIPLVADKFFAQLPDLVARFCQNGILLGTLCAVLLNLLFNVRGAEAAPQMLAKKVA